MESNAQSPGLTPPSGPSDVSAGGLPVIAIVDIGKTNKKLFLFDQQYRIVWEQGTQLPETVDDDGDPCEDLARLKTWVLTTLNEVLALPDFSVKALNFTTYGASLVYLDAEGRQIGHLYNYLKPYPETIRAQFLRDYGAADGVALQTASPWLDSLNSGLMLYRIKYDKPALFRRIWYALHLPQYMCYLVTRQMLSDLTSIGCHTLLWDFAEGRYHDWVRTERLDQLMGSLFPADRSLNALTVASPIRSVGQQPLQVGAGLHDSSAALIPYLAAFAEAGRSAGTEPNPFILISTGTWCISMNPFIEADGQRPLLTAEELAYDCLCFLHYKGRPVKASRLFAGYEHEQQTARLAAHFGVPTDYYKRVRYNAALIAGLKQAIDYPRATSVADPGKMLSLRGSVFAGRPLHRFADYETAYHQLMLDIMAGQLISTSLVLPMNDRGQPTVTRIFVDGGFSQNPLFMQLLAEAFPQTEVWAASVAQATALGAALAFHQQWNPGPVPPDLISLTRYAPASAHQPVPVSR